MKRNFDIEIKNFDGTTMLVPSSPDPAAPLKALTLKDVAVSSLNQGDGLGADEKFSRFTLAMKIHAGGNVDVTAEEIALLKSVIGKAPWTPLVLGRCFNALEEIGE